MVDFGCKSESQPLERLWPQEILEIVDLCWFCMLFFPFKSGRAFPFLGLQVIERKKTASDLAGHRSYRALVTEAEAGGVPAAAAWSNGWWLEVAKTRKRQKHP